MKRLQVMDIRQRVRVSYISSLNDSFEQSTALNYGIRAVYFKWRRSVWTCQSAMRVTPKVNQSLNNVSCQLPWVSSVLEIGCDAVAVYWFFIDQQIKTKYLRLTSLSKQSFKVNRAFAPDAKSITDSWMADENNYFIISDQTNLPQKYFRVYNVWPARCLSNWWNRLRRKLITNFAISGIGCDGCMILGIVYLHDSSNYST